MFTGIITELGRLTALDHLPNGAACIHVEAAQTLQDLDSGGSLAVNGVCLTALPASHGDHSDHSEPTSSSRADAPTTFTADVMGETLDRTTLGELRAGDAVNLERCLAAGSRFDGHIVQGHVDGVGTLVERHDEGGWTRMRIGAPAHLAPLIAEKGSIAVDGTSLTVTAVSPATGQSAAEAWFEVGLIPLTLERTRLGSLTVGDRVNLEADVLARYAARLAQFSPGLEAAPVPATPQVSERPNRTESTTTASTEQAGAR